MMRIYHHWEKWECFLAGFYNTCPPEGLSHDQAIEAYRDFLADVPRFVASMKCVIEQWPNSCDQFLSQAAMCNATGVPSAFRGGFRLLTTRQQNAANSAAAQIISQWEKMKGNQHEPCGSIFADLEPMRIS